MYKRFMLRSTCALSRSAYGPVAARLQYKDPDGVSGTCSFVRYLQVFLWLPEKDSNLNYLIQSCSRHVPARTNASGNCANLQVFCVVPGVNLSAAY